MRTTRGSSVSPAERHPRDRELDVEAFDAVVVESDPRVRGEKTTVLRDGWRGRQRLAILDVRQRRAQPLLLDGLEERVEELQAEIECGARPVAHELLPARLGGVRGGEIRQRRRVGVVARDVDEEEAQVVVVRARLGAGRW